MSAIIVLWIGILALTDAQYGTDNYGHVMQGRVVPIHDLQSIQQQGAEAYISAIIPTRCGDIHAHFWTTPEDMQKLCHHHQTKHRQYDSYQPPIYPDQSQEREDIGGMEAHINDCQRSLHDCKRNIERQKFQNAWEDATQTPSQDSEDSLEQMQTIIQPRKEQIQKFQNAPKDPEYPYQDTLEQIQTIIQSVEISAGVIDLFRDLKYASDKREILKEDQISNFRDAINTALETQTGDYKERLNELITQLSTERLKELIALRLVTVEQQQPGNGYTQVAQPINQLVTVKQKKYSEGYTQPDSTTNQLEAGNLVKVQQACSNLRSLMKQKMKNKPDLISRIDNAKSEIDQLVTDPYGQGYFNIAIASKFEEFRSNINSILRDGDIFASQESISNWRTVAMTLKNAMNGININAMSLVQSLQEQLKDPMSKLNGLLGPDSTLDEDAQTTIKEVLNELKQMQGMENDLAPDETSNKVEDMD